MSARRNPSAAVSITRWSEAVVTMPETAITPTLALLARLLVRAAAAPRPTPTADPQIPLDVAAPPKVGSGRD